jgi:threonine-phosphate decarboxylase
VGLVIGAGDAGVYRLLSPHLPAAIVALLVVLFSTLVTGGLHEDGLADAADAFGGGWKRQKIHSPSGCLMPGGIITQLQSATLSLGITTILDEAFVDYSPEVSLSGLAADLGGVVVLRTLTRFFAMPGVRVAYSVAHPENQARMKSILPLWPVGSLAASAARIALLDSALVRKTREANAHERRWLTEKMSALGVEVFPGNANYLLVRLPDGVDGFKVWRRLVVEDLIVVRNCATFEGLTRQSLRIAVRDRSANQTLANALTHVLSLLLAP